MVVFICNACNETLKKKDIEKHHFKCKNCTILSCLDCGNDFKGDDYKNHTKCITEEEKYSGKGFVVKPNANKGERKQMEWCQSVQKAIEGSSANRNLQQLLETIAAYDNIPRKKSKFEKFVSNSLNIKNVTLISQAWDLIEASVTKDSGNDDKCEKVTASSTTKKTSADAKTNSDTVEHTVVKNVKKHVEDEASFANCSQVDVNEEQHNADNAKVLKKKKKVRKVSAEHVENGDANVISSKSNVVVDQQHGMTAELTKKKKRKACMEVEQETTINDQAISPTKKIKASKCASLDLTDDHKQSLPAFVTADGSFDFKAAITHVLLNRETKTLLVSKLCKKVLRHYHRNIAENRLEPENFKRKLEKILYKYNSVVVEDNIVKLTGR